MRAARGEIRRGPIEIVRARLGKSARKADKNRQQKSKPIRGKLDRARANLSLSCAACGLTSSNELVDLDIHTYAPGVAVGAGQAAGEGGAPDGVVSAGAGACELAAGGLLPGVAGRPAGADPALAGAAAFAVPGAAAAGRPRHPGRAPSRSPEVPFASRVLSGPLSARGSCATKSFVIGGALFPHSFRT